MRPDAIALIMAGGEGSRLARSIPGVPKPLIEVGERPLIVMSMMRMIAAGIREIHVAVHHRAHDVMRALREHSDLAAARIDFIIEEEPLGTVGAIAELASTERPVLVQNGDILSGIDLAALQRHHATTSAALTIATHYESHRLELGEVVADAEGRVLEYLEKPVKQYRISSGTYVVAPQTVRLATPGEFLTIPDLVHKALDRGFKVNSFDHGAAWIDVNDERLLRDARQMFDDDPVAFGFPPARRWGEGSP